MSVTVNSLAQDSAGDKSLQEDEKRITMARATWETGWFQAEVYRLLLERLGYHVNSITTLENQEFFDALVAGEVDLWANGWFPLHELYWDEDLPMERVGMQIEAGALQGYFVDAISAKKYGITNLGDLADPEIAAVFDRTGDGKADLIGCTDNWACREIIDQQLNEYGLEDTVTQVTGHYSPMAHEVVRNQRAGLPVLFYGYTPHWLLSKLVPGEDVVWLEVPFAALPDNHDETRTLVADIDGCANNPCQTGWEPDDIVAVANSDFLEANPSVRTLLEQIIIPLEDIIAQNVRMVDGEGSAADIRRHAEEWITANEATVDEWLHTADPDAVPVSVGDEDEAAGFGGVLRVAARTLPPFVTYQDGTFGGFEVELAKLVADRLGMELDIYAVDAVARQIDDVFRGAADIALGGVTIVRPPAEITDFSLPILSTGLTILVPTTAHDGLRNRISDFGSAIAGSDLPWLFGVFLIFVLITSHIIWRLERHRNPDFAETYGKGLWDSFYWSVVTMSTVGYGDKVPRGNIGRAFTLLWIAIGTLIFAAFTASIASSLAVEQLRGGISGPSELHGNRIATVAGSTGDEYLNSTGLAATRVDDITRAYELLEDHKVDAVVFDAPVLNYHASSQGGGEVQTVGPEFERVQYGFAVGADNPELRKNINLALLDLLELDLFQQLEQKWFGAQR